ncbi:hypothetical protein [Methylobacterium persicinum]|uniref:DUF3035 domain-containing protein n=1 Tax=Methylobacterium persicinum TaxID=374426 RepID=A0ABU0HID9_9HYPH|nr:hypothetical protein [Methylobacterium persicinum]MDQ0441251.1 hypothetical protein [Methylobacterium persicinum]GJE36005.1 hypothetical protein KHHGKMAE_0051 [Methylobacterium persicinum]
MTVVVRRCLILALLVSPLLSPLAACSGDTVRTLAADAGYGPKKVDAPDFVTSSRPKETPDYMAVGVDAPRRAIRPKNTEGQKALESELESARGRNVARGHAAESAAKGVAKGIAPPSDPAAKPSAKPATPPPQ